jgi:inorganic pyrophosphatase
VSIQKYLVTGTLEIERYSPRKNLAKDHVAFSGMPRKHPYDPEKLLLLADPFSTHAVFYEFNLADIGHVEELPNLGTESGESIRIARVWVKAGSFGLRYEPFRVEATAGLPGLTAPSAKGRKAAPGRVPAPSAAAARAARKRRGPA